MFGISAKDGNSDITSRVYEKQVLLLYDNMVLAVLTMAGIVPLSSLFFSRSVGWESLTGWILLFYVVFGFRLATYLIYKNSRKKLQIDPHQGELWFTIGIIATGTVWSTFSMTLMPVLDLPGKVLLLVVIMGIVSASVTTVGYRLMAINLYIPLLLAPIAFIVNVSDFPNSSAITIAILVYMAFLFRTSSTFYKNSESSLKLQEIAVGNERILKQQREEAELANKTKTEFLSRMSHELRTPLNAVLGLNELQLLDRQSPLSEVQRNRAVKIGEAGQHLLSLVNDVLDFSCVESGALNIDIKPVNCLDVIQQSLKLIEQRAKSRELQIFFEGAEENTYVNADENRLKQVILNLLDNAVKYNQHGGSISITIAASKVRDGYLRISIIDTGYGFDESDRNELFKPFSRLRAPELGIDGTGIGLSYSKQLVELMQGYIGADCRNGEGSCFWIELKTADLTESSQPGAIAVSNQLITAVDIQQARNAAGKLLLVEDNIVNQEVAIDMLSQLGYQIDVVNNGEEAVNAFKNNEYSLVLMDCEMPVMDGYEATKKLRVVESAEHKKNKTPIIALTAHAVDSAREKCLQSGMSDFLSKPFSFSKLESVIDAWIFEGNIPSHDSNDLSDAPPDKAGEHADEYPVQSTVDAAPVSPRDTNAVINLQALDNIKINRSSGSKDLVVRVIKLYLEQTPELISDIEKAAVRNDAEMLLFLSHKLKSTSLTVGATQLADTCRLIELSSGQGDIEKESISKLDSQYKIVASCLKQIMTK